jgi:tol-pal system protein YbgF
MNHVIKKIGGLILLNHNKLKILLLACICLPLLSCATVQEVDELKELVASQQSRIKKMDQRLRGMEDSSSDKKKKGQTQVFDKLQDYDTEIQNINNRIDEIEFLLGTTNDDEPNLGRGKKNLRQEIDELKTKVNSLNAKISGSSSTISTPVPQQQPTPSTNQPDQTNPATAEKPVAIQNDKTLYDQAYSAYSSNQADKARELFELVIEQFPQSKYVPNAKYWIGECYYKTGAYEDAILAFEDLIKKHPNSEKVPAAMLKQGYAFYNSNDKQNGKYMLEKLIQKYPNSDEAKKAKAKLSGG